MFVRLGFDLNTAKFLAVMLEARMINDEPGAARSDQNEKSAFCSETSKATGKSRRSVMAGRA
ncbi:hypothetical protein [Methylocystis sp.]|uniref:hypothetical protein n=1 Tax=Methylocystis sp. TaxID=1911079 RepID=UPI003DA2C704